MSPCTRPTTLPPGTSGGPRIPSSRCVLVGPLASISVATGLFLTHFPERGFGDGVSQLELRPLPGLDKKQKRKVRKLRRTCNTKGCHNRVFRVG
eukprot:9483052-Pyramimonas_sp.AAC.2